MRRDHMDIVNISWLFYKDNFFLEAFVFRYIA